MHLWLPRAGNWWGRTSVSVPLHTGLQGLGLHPVTRAAVEGLLAFRPHGCSDAHRAEKPGSLLLLQAVAAPLSWQLSLPCNSQRYRASGSTVRASPLPSISLSS